MNKIPIPTKEEKEKAINKIISNGMTPQENFIQRIVNLYMHIGTKYIFGDILDCLIIAITSTVLIYFFSLSFRIMNTELSTTFAISPIFYIILTLATEWKEKMSHLYELKMTCKYTVKQITAIRLLCFSALGVLFSSLMSMGYSLIFTNESLLDIFIVSLLGLLINSLLALGVMLYGNRRNSHNILIGLWFAVFLLPPVIWGKGWNVFLGELPYLLITVLILIMAAIYLLGIKKLITEREVILYANR